MSESALAPLRREPADPARALRAFRPTSGLVVALVLSLLPFFVPVAAAYQHSVNGTMLVNVQGDVAGLVFPTIALGAMLLALVQLCGRSLRGPRILHVALLLGTVGLAGFQFVYALAKLV